jgi:hypothetical protein
VVQKTCTADRPGEFGGGDVQVHTRDFPGRRVWSLSVSQTDVSGVTFHDRATYSSTAADLFGFGAAARDIPAAIGDRPLVLGNPFGPYYKRSQLAVFAREFDSVWSPGTTRAIPNAGYTATYGDEFKLLAASPGSATASRAAIRCICAACSPTAPTTRC